MLQNNQQTEEPVNEHGPGPAPQYSGLKCHKWSATLLTACTSIRIRSNNVLSTNNEPPLSNMTHLKLRPSYQCTKTLGNCLALVHSKSEQMMPRRPEKNQYQRSLLPYPRMLTEYWHNARHWFKLTSQQYFRGFLTNVLHFHNCTLALALILKIHVKC